MESGLIDKEADNYKEINIETEKIDRLGGSEARTNTGCSLADKGFLNSDVESTVHTKEADLLRIITRFTYTEYLQVYTFYTLFALFLFVLKVSLDIFLIIKFYKNGPIILPLIFESTNILIVVGALLISKNKNFKFFNGLGYVIWVKIFLTFVSPLAFKEQLRLFINQFGNNYSFFSIVFNFFLLSMMYFLNVRVLRFLKKSQGILE